MSELPLYSYARLFELTAGVRDERCDISGFKLQLGAGCSRVIQKFVNHHQVRAVGSYGVMFLMSEVAASGMGTRVIFVNQRCNRLRALRALTSCGCRGGRAEVGDAGGPSTLNAQPSTLHPQPCTLNPQSCTLNSQP